VLLVAVVAAALGVMFAPGPLDLIGLSDFRARMLGLLTGADLTETTRPYLWRMALAAVQRSPLFGLGVGNFVNPVVWASLAAQISAPDWLTGPDDVHSIFLGMLADLGIVGGGLLVAAIGYALWSLVRARRDTRTGRAVDCRPAVTALLLGMIGYFSAATFIPVHDFPFPYLLLGLVGSVPRLVRRRELNAA
jgi:O-antigen ligase